MNKFLVFLLFFSLSAKSQSWIWENHAPKQLSTDSVPFNYHSTTIGQNGNIYVLHNLYYSSTDIIKSTLTSYTATGNLLWKKDYPFYINKIIASPSGELFIATNFTDSLTINSDVINSKGSMDILIIKMDWQGAIITYKTFGTLSGEIANGLCMEGNDLIISGTYSHTLHIDSDSLISNGSNNAFLLRFDNQLNLKNKFITDCTRANASKLTIES